MNSETKRPLYPFSRHLERSKWWLCRVISPEGLRFWYLSHGRKGFIERNGIITDSRICTLWTSSDLLIRKKCFDIVIHIIDMFIHQNFWNILVSFGLKRVKSSCSRGILVDIKVVYYYIILKPLCEANLNEWKSGSVICLMNVHVVVRCVVRRTQVVPHDFHKKKKMQV
jgi:hypothetical protein